MLKGGNTLEVIRVRLNELGDGCSERITALVNESWFALDSLCEDLPHLVVARLLREAPDLAEQELLENQLSELVVLLVSFLCE